LTSEMRSFADETIRIDEHLRRMRTNEMLHIPNSCLLLKKERLPS